MNNQLSIPPNLIKILIWLMNGVASAFLLLGVFNLVILYFVPLHPGPARPSIERTVSAEVQQDQYVRAGELNLVKRNEPEEDKKQENSKSKLGDVDIESVKKVKKSTLPLEVIGISYGPPGFRAVTLRNLKSRTVRTLLAGETWEEARIQAIRRNEVLLMNKETDQTELLELNRGRSITGKQSETSDETQKISRYQVNKAIQSNMDKLLTNVEVRPAFQQGKIIGFKIQNFKGRPGKLMENLGFQTDDIISRVNGKKINGMDQALKLWSSLKYQKNFDIQVLRDGERMNFKYQLTR